MVDDTVGDVSGIEDQSTDGTSFRLLVCALVIHTSLTRLNYVTSDRRN